MTFNQRAERLTKWRSSSVYVIEVFDLALALLVACEANVSRETFREIAREFDKTFKYTIPSFRGFKGNIFGSDLDPG